jgi:hypothetical protein
MASWPGQIKGPAIRRASAASGGTSGTGTRGSPAASRTRPPGTSCWPTGGRTSWAATCPARSGANGTRDGADGGATSPLPCPGVRPGPLPARSDRDAGRNDVLVCHRRVRRSPGSGKGRGRPGPGVRAGRSDPFSVPHPHPTASAANSDIQDSERSGSPRTGPPPVNQAEVTAPPPGCAPSPPTPAPSRAGRPPGRRHPPLHDIPERAFAGHVAFLSACRRPKTPVYAVRHDDIASQAGEAAR